MDPVKPVDSYCANHSLFKKKPCKNVLIEIAWKGPFKTLTREYTYIKLYHQDFPVAVRHISDRSSDVSGVLILDVSAPLCFADNQLTELELKIDYLKCDACKPYRSNVFTLVHASGEVIEYPIHRERGASRIVVDANIKEEDGACYRLTIHNRANTGNTDFFLEAYLESIEHLTPEPLPAELPVVQSSTNMCCMS